MEHHCLNTQDTSLNFKLLFLSHRCQGGGGAVPLIFYLCFLRKPALTCTCSGALPVGKMPVQPLGPKVFSHLLVRELCVTENVHLSLFCTKWSQAGSFPVGLRASSDSCWLWDDHIGSPFHQCLFCSSSLWIHQRPNLARSHLLRDLSICFSFPFPLPSLSCTYSVPQGDLG